MKPRQEGAGSVGGDNGDDGDSGGNGGGIGGGGGVMVVGMVVTTDCITLLLKKNSLIHSFMVVAEKSSSGDLNT